MKTSKFKYKVECFNELSLVDVIDCVTLAEARMVASRYFRATISCTGIIEYRLGLEVEK